MVTEHRKIEKGPIRDKPVVTPIDPDKLSFEDKRKVLEAVNIIKENICGKIK